MNKLEQAIRKNSDEGDYSSSFFSGSETNGIEEISKMEVSFLLSKDEMISKKIIFPGMKNKALYNSFRELRASITGDDSRSIVMITALNQKSGTSFFARNLASAIAFDTSKTALLVDCNNNSEVGSTFNITNSNGISDYVTDDNLEVEDIIYESGVKRLRVIPFGEVGEKVDEQYNHPKFKSLLNEIKNKYQNRNIIIDAPPMLNSADSRILLNLCDQVVVVIPYGSVSKTNLQEAISLIGRDKLAGVVFNDYLN